MKTLFDLLPVILFFAVYKKTDDIYTATAVLMVAMTIQVAGLWIIKKKVEKQYLFTLAAILVLGGLTLFLRDPDFIKWKPTIVNWILALAFLASQFIGHENMVKKMMGHAMELPDNTWHKVNLSWVAFFIFSGAANLYVAFNYSEETWVDFKLFGLTGLSFLFIIGMMLALKDHLKEPPPDTDESGGPKEET